MPDFRFKRLEKYQVRRTQDSMELQVPLPQSPSGKVYRWCHSDNCTPRLFLLGGAERPEDLDLAQLKRTPGTPGTTCPYCGNDADDTEFNYEGDISAIIKYMEWAVLRDTSEYLESIARNFNRSQRRGGFITLKMDVKPKRVSEPKAWREDLIRNLACDICGREYGVYAIALFCPDCGSRNLHVHFEREINLVLQQIDLAERMAEAGDKELSYRLLGNAHEDVLTAFETYQKTFYRHVVRRSFSGERSKKMTSKGAIGNRFQNIDRASALYATLSLDPFSTLTLDELSLVKRNIEKRHIIGHNLSMVDEAYADTQNRELPGTTVEILADEISEFALTAKKMILELERLL